MLATWAAVFCTFGVGIAILLLNLFVYMTKLYTLLPGWASVKRFDATSHPNTGYNQLLIDKEFGGMKHEADGKQVNPPKVYGAIGKCTWGSIEAPWDKPEPMPGGPEGKTIRNHFTDTQFLRSHSSWWARDEPHYMKEAHAHVKPLGINQEYISCPARMV
eukprot:TRINITY_DN80970_c0_g1_i1.p1 TRINITY_DN80970_c0_g1~~TRINITY_DN80970_c0_g1_i1.p1  ORF type:complete len:160 (+),score=42.22 TRINITY_DN80970_c0_g1_i1:143-622(+)